MKLQRFSRSFLALGGALLPAVLAFACHTTEDPRPGVAKKGTASTADPLPPPFDAGVVPDAAGLPEGPYACGAPPVSTAPFTKAALLGATADCAAYHVCRFANAAHVLRTTVDAEAKDGTKESRALAQLAWQRAMDEWSHSALFQFGPVADKATDKYHGRSLRTLVHAWPDTSRCQVETQVVLKGYQGGFDLVFPSSRGLFALEYLLYYPGTDTACSASSQAGGAWASLVGDAQTKAKRDYAVAAAGDLVAQADTLRKVWAPDGENFKAKLLAFDGYGNEQEALNVVAWSMFYVEQEVKDLKLGSYAGFQTAPPNPETAFARVDIENIRTNVRAFRELFVGCGAAGEGLGFDDWLVASGNGALAKELLDLYAQAQAAADAFPPFYQASPQQFADLYLKIRPLANLLKTQLFGSGSPLNLKLPASAASDTD